MMTIKTFLNKKLIMIVLVIALLSCVNTKDQPSQKKVVNQKKTSQRIIVMGVDDTGSYKLWGPAKEKAIRIIEQLKPGDIFYYRRITGASYLDDCSILYIKIPVKQMIESQNPFDRRAKKNQRTFLFRVNRLKRDAINKLSVLKFSNAKKTDINGFFAAAIDRFNHSPKHFQKILIISSDLKDNIGFKVKLDFIEVHVAVIGFQVSKDPTKVRTLKSQWIKKFKEAGANSVLFLPMEEKFNIDLFKET